MKTFVFFTFAVALLLSACAGSAQKNTKNDSAPVTAASTDSAYNYKCDSGEMILATYASTESATIQYKGNSYSMQIAVSASGARYVGGAYEWWGKGSSMTLYRHMTDGTTGESLERCTAK